MRMEATIKNDIRYQMKYGFYFLYLFITVIYIGVILLVPARYQDLTASIVMISDPAMLGFFFIGGIWLLERGEGLHRFFVISPLKPIEYILAKAVSLGLLSTGSVLAIMLIGVRDVKAYPVILFSVFIGSMIFTILGMTVATYARTVNHYLLISIPAEMFIVLPAALTAFGIHHPVLEFLPGTMLWRLITRTYEAPGALPWWMLILGLLVWLGISVDLAMHRIPAALLEEGGVM
jgi:fluoroquinolone transport system permease protein